MKDIFSASGVMILAALAGAALAVMGVFATNPTKNIPRSAVTPQWPIYYTEVNPMHDVNNVNPWFGGKMKDPYMVAVRQRPTVDYGDDIFGTDTDIYGGGVL